MRSEEHPETDYVRAIRTKVAHGATGLADLESAARSAAVATRSARRAERAAQQAVEIAASTAARDAAARAVAATQGATPAPRAPALSEIRARKTQAALDLLAQAHVELQARVAALEALVAALELRGAS